MGLRISTNASALVIERHLHAQSQAEKSSVMKLSSGSRINQAADDAAGLSISEHLRADSRSLRQAVRNANDGISLVQVAEGAMNELSNILVRMRELSIQSASDTISDTERGFIDKEAQQLKQEMERIAKTTTFNGQPLLTTGPHYLEIQTGIGNNPDEDRLYIDTWLQNSTISNLGLSGLSIATKKEAQENLDVIDQALEHVNRNRAGLGALQNRMTSAINNESIYNENLTGAESRIRDADYAHETAEMTRNKILANTSIAVLSQANQDGKLALKLLG